MAMQDRVEKLETIRVGGLDDFALYWPFFSKGLDVARATHGGNQPTLTSDEFFRHLLMIATTEDEGDALLLILRRGQTLLGYAAINDNTSFFGPRSFIAYMLYSTGEYKYTVPRLKKEVLGWAAQHGYKVGQALGYRLTGSADRWFNGIGFRRRAVLYELKV